jgi:hypothetical protein
MKANSLCDVEVGGLFLMFFSNLFVLYRSKKKQTTLAKK